MQSVPHNQVIAGEDFKGLIRLGFMASIRTLKNPDDDVDAARAK